MVLDDITAHDKFMVMLEWMLALDQRYADSLQAGLVHVRYDAAEVRDLTLDASDAAGQLSEVMHCLQRAFRGSDLIMREGAAFWILTPFTQIDPVIEKVKHVVHHAPQNGLAIAHSDVQIYLLKHYRDSAAFKRRNARDVLDFLKTQEPHPLTVPAPL